MNTSVHFIALSEQIWSSLPEDRSFAELAKDALAMERLMAKEVEPQIQQLRYMQMCRRLQSLAMQHIHKYGVSDYLAWKGKEAEKYLNLLTSLEQKIGNTDIFKSQPQSTTNTGYVPREKNIVGKSFYQPGTDTKNQSMIFRQVKTPNEDIMQIALQKSNFYQKAYYDNAAVIEVVTFS